MHSFTLATARVVAPATSLAAHILIQQHVAALYQDPDFRNKSSIIAIKKVDMRRIFGDLPPKEFYLNNGQYTTYVALRADTDVDTYYGTIIALSNEILSKITEDDQPSLNLAGQIQGTLPTLRFTLLASEGFLQGSKLANHLAVVDAETHKKALAGSKFDFEDMSWVANNDPEEEQRPKFHLKDIPLNTRAGRILVRDTLLANAIKLEQQWQLWMADKTPEQELTHDEWLEQVQGVNIAVLNQLADLDKLPDNEYVEAMVGFKKAEAQAMHSNQINRGKTELHLFDWVKETFEEEFNDLGRAAALKDIEGIASDEAVAEETVEQTLTAVFVVTFDGTIVENQKPVIGPVSPYAIDVLKALKSHGHIVILHTDRDDEDVDAAIKFLKVGHDFLPHGVVNCIGASDVLDEMTNGLRFLTDLTGTDLEGATEEEGIEFDYFIDHRHFGAATMNLSGAPGIPATLYWGELASSLAANGYLTEEDVNAMQEALSKVE